MSEVGEIRIDIPEEMSTAASSRSSDRDFLESNEKLDWQLLEEAINDWKAKCHDEEDFSAPEELMERVVDPDYTGMSSVESEFEEFHMSDSSSNSDLFIFPSHEQPTVDNHQVFILSKGEYEDQNIINVFATLDRAKEWVNEDAANIRTMYEDKEVDLEKNCWWKEPIKWVEKGNIIFTIGSWNYDIEKYTVIQK